MDTFLKKHGFKLLVLLLLLGIGGYVLYNSIANDGRSFPKNEPAYDFTLTNLDGEQVSLSDSNGKVRLLYFFFSNCPDVCPPTTQMMAKVQRAMKEAGVDDKTQFISVTIDPIRDTPERMREFADYYNVDYSSWDFLRGEDEQEIWDIAKEFDVGVIKFEDGNFGHSNLYTLIDKDGNVRKLYAVGQDVEAFNTDPMVEDMLYLAKK